MMMLPTLQTLALTVANACEAITTRLREQAKLYSRVIY